MSTREAYNEWSSQYDTNENKTRDLEGRALREILSAYTFDHCLELGCGTGKNSSWFVEQAKEIVSADLSEEMLAIAKEKIKSPKIKFQLADINKPWSFGVAHYDLISFSLVLEHIENLDHIFSESVKTLKEGGMVYIGELHPFKQYSGSKARFATATGEKEVPCFTHHISDYTGCAEKSGLRLLELKEYFDDDAGKGIPRILCLVFKKGK